MDASREGSSSHICFCLPFAFQCRKSFDIRQLKSRWEHGRDLEFQKQENMPPSDTVQRFKARFSSVTFRNWEDEHMWRIGRLRALGEE